MTIELPFVMEFILYITNRCNLACEMCSQYGENFKENAPKEMSLSEWDNFFQSISDVNPKPKLILLGGEPLLYKNFDELIKLIKKYDFPLHIVTNGTLLDKHFDVLYNSSATITLSIDGLEDKHDKIRGTKGTFRKIINNIIEANKLQEAGANFKLLVNSVILPDNVDEIADFLDYMQQFNIEQFVFQHLQSSSKCLIKKTNDLWQKYMGKDFGAGFEPKKEYNLDNEYIERIKNSFKKIIKVCKTETFVFPYLTDEEMPNYYLEKNLDEIRPHLLCATPWLSPSITPDGFVANCIGNTIGNIREENFWALWNNEKANKIRTLLCQKGSLDFCKKCCNFYKSNFLIAPNCKLKLGNKTIVLPAELNFLKPSPDGVFVVDETRCIINNEIPVKALEVHSEKQLNLIKETEQIVGFFKDINHH